jgi:SAM-dependent methyltransferase
MIGAMRRRAQAGSQATCGREHGYAHAHVYEDEDEDEDEDEHEHEDEDEHDPVAAAGAAYSDAGPVYASYIAAKLRIDPIHRVALDLLPSAGHIVDLGCGAGQLALLVATTSRARVVTGIDRDPRRIARAQAALARVAGPHSLRYQVADVREIAIPAARAILLVDVLHSLRPSDQDALLRRAAAALEPGGLLLVREVDRAAPRWRYLLVALEERLARASGWAARGDGLHFRRAAELADVLHSAGLVVETRPLWGRTPYANVLLTGRRP